MIATTKETDLKAISNEELFELQQGFVKLHEHATSSLEEVMQEWNRRLETNFKK
jgi:hypothetical protein|tara:strand:- start:602 stop:763 length:162 start_codon:yes stop_codon:yes gene_type:complete